jgi:hypothetical protein
VRYFDPPVYKYGITMLEPDGSMQLTEHFDALSAIFASYNTDLWLSGATIANLKQPEIRECSRGLIGDRTSSIRSSSATLTLASEWVLPTRPSELVAIITSDMQGPRGQMIDVLVTTVKHQIRDSKGGIMTDVVLSPSKSETRSTTASVTAGGTASTNLTPLSGLNPGVKAGIGVGVGIGGAIALLAIGFFLLRRRKS